MAALSPYDKNTLSPNPGARAVLPHAEARVAFLLRGASKVKVDLGVGAKYGEEKWILADDSDETVETRAVAVDLKVEVGPVALVGGAFAGENLDVESSIAPGVLTAGTSPDFTSVKSVPTKGGWAQLQVVPVKGLQLLAGAGIEIVDEDLIGAAAVQRNLQLSGGAIVNLTSRWRAGVEYTRYVTETNDGETTRASQVEVSTLLAL